MASNGAIRIGISGWRYKPWRGVFYPSDLPQRRELEFASHQLSTIEINGSFYSLQTPRSYASWYEETPASFLFAVKGGRFITHMLKLRKVEEPLANFFASGLLNLREKLGPILWQFPPTLKYDRSRLEPFLELLPHDTQAASRLARRHSEWMKGRVQLGIDATREIRHAIEIRHKSFLNPTFIELLRDHGVALVIAETAGRWPLYEDLTADFVYIRLHGDQELYRSGYGDRALERWAQRIRDWSRGREPSDARKVLDSGSPKSKGRDVFCYFDNTDVKLRAPFDARALMQKLGLLQAPVTGSVRPQGGRKHYSGLRAEKAESGSDRQPANARPDRTLQSRLRARQA